MSAQGGSGIGRIRNRKIESDALPLKESVIDLNVLESVLRQGRVIQKILTMKFMMLKANKTSTYSDFTLIYLFRGRGVGGWLDKSYKSGSHAFAISFSSDIVDSL